MKIGKEIEGIRYTELNDEDGVVRFYWRYKFAVNKKYIISGTDAEVDLAVFRWCCANLSSPSSTNWTVYSNRVYIRNEEDAVAFKLRWV